MKPLKWVKRITLIGPSYLIARVGTIEMGTVRMSISTRNAYEACALRGHETVSITTDSEDAGKRFVENQWNEFLKEIGAVK